MLNGLYLSAMGAKVQDARADVVANNLANVNTVAFRREQAVFRKRLSAAAERPEWAFRAEPRLEAVGGGVFLARIAAMDEPGPLDHTGRPLDVAVDGEGFFKVRGTDGVVSYTRAGNLRRDEQGYLVSGDGRSRVQGEAGGDLQLPPGQIDINDGGEVFADGALIDRIGLVMPADPSRMSKRGEGLWSAGGIPGEAPATGRIRQGFLEGSSVEPMRDMTEMIGAQRLYELSLKAMRMQDEILGRAVTDVGSATGRG